MNADPLRAGSGGEEDSWETLAEDLFGINLNSGPAGDSLIAPDDLALDEPVQPAAKDKPREPEKAPQAEAPRERPRSEPPRRAPAPEPRRTPERHADRPSRPARPKDDDFG